MASQSSKSETSKSQISRSETSKSKRNYRQYCAVARALDVVGERWTLLLVRELFSGPKRYSDLRQELVGMGSNLLAARLKHLEAEGLVERETLPSPAASQVYGLTRRGRELEPVLVELARFGLPYLRDRRAPTDHYRARWAPLVLKACFRPALAKGLTEEYEFRVGEEVFFARIEDGAVESDVGPARQPAATLLTDLATFERLVSGDLRPADQDRLTVVGDQEAWQRCAALFRPTAS